MIYEICSIKGDMEGRSSRKNDSPVFNENAIIADHIDFDFLDCFSFLWRCRVYADRWRKVARMLLRHLLLSAALQNALATGSTARGSTASCNGATQPFVQLARAHEQSHNPHEPKAIHNFPSARVLRLEHGNRIR